MQFEHFAPPSTPSPERHEGFFHFVKPPQNREGSSTSSSSSSTAKHAIISMLEFIPMVANKTKSLPETNCGNAQEHSHQQQQHQQPNLSGQLGFIAAPADCHEERAAGSSSSPCASCSSSNSVSQNTSPQRDASPRPHPPDMSSASPTSKMLTAMLMMTTTTISANVEDNKEASLRNQGAPSPVPADNRAASLNGIQLENGGEANPTVDNREASLQHAQAASSACSTSIVAVDGGAGGGRSGGGSTSPATTQTTASATSSSSNPSPASFFAASVRNITWCFDVVQRHPFISFVALASFARIAYRLRLFSVSFIHNSLPWIRFGSEVAATGGWMKLVFCGTNSIFAVFARYYPAQFQQWFSTFRRDSDSCHNNNNDNNKNDSNNHNFQNNITNNNNSSNSHASARPSQYLSVLDASPHREQIRAASASLSPGERYQLRNFYVVSCSPASTAARGPAGTSEFGDEDDEKGRDERCSREASDSRQQQTTKHTKKTHQQLLVIDEARIAVVNRFKSLPLEWRRQVGQISERHWEIYAMSLGVIPQWDQDLMNQVREAVLFSPCPQGWKLKLFADEVESTSADESDNEDKTQNGEQNRENLSDDDEEFCLRGEEQQQHLASAANAAVPTFCSEQRHERSKKIVRGGIRFVDPRIEAPHAWHADNQFTVESIRAEAVRRLRQQSNRRRTLVQLLGELVAVNKKTTAATIFQHDQGQNDDPQQQYTFGSSFTFGSPIAGASGNESFGSFLGATVTTSCEVQKCGFDDDDENDTVNVDGECAIGLRSDEEVFQQLQVAAAESPQRLRSELIRRGHGRHGATHSDVSHSTRQRGIFSSSSTCASVYHERRQQAKTRGASNSSPVSGSYVHHDDHEHEHEHEALPHNLTQPIEFDLTSPTKREVEASLDETVTMQSVDNLLRHFMERAPASCQHQHRFHQRQQKIPAADLFSQLLSQTESSANFLTPVLVDASPLMTERNDDHDADSAAPLTPRTNNNEPHSPVKRVFSSQGKGSVAVPPTPHAA